MFPQEDDKNRKDTLHCIAMHGSGKFCPRGSNFDNIFLVNEGISWAIISLQGNRWCADVDLILNAGLVAL